MPDPRTLSRSTIESRILVAEADGATISTPFPFVRRLATYVLTKDTGLVGLTLSSSIVNITAGVAGAFVAQDQGLAINLLPSGRTQIPANVFISQITHQNSTIGTIAPAARTNSLAFGEETSILPMRAGSGISIYACMDNNAANLFAATLSIYTITL
ncbi:hypothetical protein EBZ80_07140 [bacterium]|nr:hypothetical protein [bacterium]